MTHSAAADGKFVQSFPMMKHLKNNYFNARGALWLLVLWQLISTLLMALGVWPGEAAWLNFALVALFIGVVDSFLGTLLLIVSIPFFVVLPNSFMPSLPSWRLLFIWLFAVWFVRTAFAQRQYLGKALYFRQLYQDAKILGRSKFDVLVAVLQRIDSRFFSWDKYLALFVFVAALSLVFARFPGHGLKQIIFLANVYLLYVVLINTTTSRDRLIQLIKYTTVSLATIVGLGYVQFIATLFSEPYYFWQYWAVMVSKVYYGLDLANVLIYSNSWFSYSSSGQSLRMFSIMPDSHSFAMIAVLAMTFLLALICLHRAEPMAFAKKFLTRQYYLWYAVRFSGFAVILSGTRGMWVGMIPAFLLGLWLYWKKLGRGVFKKILIAQLLIIILFPLSPLINTGLNWLRVSAFKENFIERAASIYDLQDSSNQGRLIIWKDSLLYSFTHPFGVGYGNFVTTLVRDIPQGSNFDEVSEERNLRYNLPQKFVSAHSLYLNILVELGFAGLLVSLLFCWEFFGKVWAFIKARRDQENVFTMFVAGFGLTMVWFLAYSVFDVTLFNDKVLMYFFISLAVVGIILRRYEGFEEAKPEILKPGV
jgi:O-antigen ligase